MSHPIKYSQSIRSILLFCFCLACLFSFGQAKDWVLVRVDNNISLKMPGTPVSTPVAHGFRVLDNYKDSISYRVSVSDSLFLRVPNENLFRISLLGIKDGTIGKEEFKNYIPSSRDTVLNGMPGIFLNLHNNADNENVKDIFYFITIQDARPYFIIAYTYMPLNDRVKKDISDYYSSLTFYALPFPGFTKKD